MHTNTDTQLLVQSLYKDEYGNPIELSRGQDYIFRSIAKRQTPRIHIMCHTRYGKSLTVGLAVLTRASTFPEKWAIIAGTKDKAKIIMDYIIAHIFDNDFTKNKFVPEKGEDVDDIRRYRNKNRVNFLIDEVTDPITGKRVKRYGEIFVGAAKDALGFGAPNVVEDEAALIENPEHSLVMRMLGDNPHNNFLVKIGNPFNRNHFLDSYHDPSYRKVIIDCYKSLGEGRITQEIINENREYPFFKVLYECRFPSGEEMDISGWLHLLSDTDIKTAVARQNTDSGQRILGVDVQRGGRNYNAWVLRTNTTARVIKKTLAPDLLDALEDTINIMRDNGIDERSVNIDDAGIGGGLVDMLKMRGIEVNGVNFGERSVDDETCSNIRAQVYAGKDGLMQWVKTHGQLLPHKDWIELTRIRYKKDMTGRTKIESKDDMRKRGIESPDVADALALTFAKVKKSAYHGINPQQVLQSGAPSEFGGVSW